MIKYLLEKNSSSYCATRCFHGCYSYFPLYYPAGVVWVANFEIKNMNLSIVDNDRSPILPD